MIAERGLGGRVTLHGYRSHAEVAALMARASMFVQHSVTDPDGKIEGFPVAIAEAMFTALPVVSTRHSGIPEHVQDGISGFLVAEHDVAGMAGRHGPAARRPGGGRRDGPGRPGLGARASVAAGRLPAAARSDGAGGAGFRRRARGLTPMPGDRPPVTLFVLAYNQEALVRAAIEGAFAQTYQPLEIILSDDASPDGTFAVMQAMAAAYSGPHRVILNRNPANLGLTAHVSRVMAAARPAASWCRTPATTSRTRSGSRGSSPPGGPGPAG